MAIDKQYKFKVVPEVIHHKPLVVEVTDTKNHYPNNPRWPPDVDVLNGKVLAIDCDLLIGGCRYG